MFKVDRSAILVGILSALVALTLADFFQPTPSPSADPEPPAGNDDQGVSVRLTSFEDISGWQSDRHRDALDAFARSCASILRRDPSTPLNRRETAMEFQGQRLISRVGDWVPACERAISLVAEAVPSNTAQAFFETYFDAVTILEKTGTSLITGYFEPRYQARRAPDGIYSTPALTRPSDLVSINLRDFDPSLPARVLTGRLQGQRLVAYDDHAQIVASAPSTSEAIAYLDPNDLLFLQIQGSGQLEFDDGSLLRIGYADKNGRAYTAIGRSLLNEGHLARSEITMQSIREWLSNAAPDDAARIRYTNASYVFFRELSDLEHPDLGPLGAQGIQLTPWRSVAIDPRYYPYGAPIWLSAPATDVTPAINQLFVAQDTGGAIRGAQRADVFFGAGADAALLAGGMNTPGGLIVLLPKPVLENIGHGSP